MSLHTPTLTALLCLQLALVALALSWISGWRSSVALRWAIAAIWLQLASWLTVLATPLAGIWATAASYVLGALTFSLALQALGGWLGPRPLQRWAWLAPALLLLCFAVGQDIGWMRRGLSNLLMGGQLLLLLAAVVAPASEAAPSSRRWRQAMGLPLALLAICTLTRAAYGFGPEEAYPSLRSQHPVALATLVIGNLATMVMALAFLAAWRGEAERLLREAAQTDPLTGLANRRELERRSSELIHNARRHGDTLVALLIDLDHFKRVNDEQGHAQGDAALRLIAALLKELARPGDCVARIGGEEFVVLLARSQPDGATAFDRRLREALAAAALPQLGFALDYSAGWARLRAGDRHVHDLLARADAALYRAKEAGRGRLCAEPGSENDEHEPG
jgi:diguanylate cyclase (GGDEF)-like protein